MRSNSVRAIPSRALRSTSRTFARLVAGVACLGLGLGCATSSPDRQEFVEVRTERFRVTSSLSPEATIAFARSLEFFHAGVRNLAGLDAAPPLEPPMPVFVFDDRSFGRPFAVESEAAFLIDDVAAPVIVFRGARDFAARATPEFRQRLARRILRDHAPDELPLWYEEGGSRLASSILETGEGVLVGRMIDEDQRAVLDWRGHSVAAALGRFDLSGASQQERARFTAQAFAIAHTLEFAPRSRRPGGGTLLGAFQTAITSPDVATRDRAFAAIGLSPEHLAARVYRHLEQGPVPVRQLEARGFDPRRLSAEALTPSESRLRMGRLALGLDRPALAREIFERLLARTPDSIAARIGLAEALARLGEPDAAMEQLAGVRLPDDPTGPLALDLADAHRAVAVATGDEPVRRDALAAARALYDGAQAEAAATARAAEGLARLALEVPGQDPAAATPWLDVAHRARAGSLEIELLRALVDARTGHARSAMVRLRNVVTRSPDAQLRDRARALLESGVAASD